MRGDVARVLQAREVRDLAEAPHDVAQRARGFLAGIVLQRAVVREHVHDDAEARFQRRAGDGDVFGDERVAGRGGGGSERGERDDGAASERHEHIRGDRLSPDDRARDEVERDAQRLDERGAPRRVRDAEHGDAQERERVHRLRENRGHHGVGHVDVARGARLGEHRRGEHRREEKVPVRAPAFDRAAEIRGRRGAPQPRKRQQTRLLVRNQVAVAK